MTAFIYLHHTHAHTQTTGNMLRGKKVVSEGGKNNGKDINVNMVPVLSIIKIKVKPFSCAFYLSHYMAYL